MLGGALGGELAIDGVVTAAARVPSEERCALQLIKVFEQYMLDAVTGVQPTLERLLHMFGVIRGQPVDAARGIFKAELIVEKPSIDLARRELATAGLPAGNYLAHFGIHVFSPRIS